jgi:hypothetical protein
METDLRHYPWIVLRFRCDYCRRWADGGLAACAEKFGAATTLAEMLERFMMGCPWRPDHRKPQKYGRNAGALCPDVGRTDPRDLPPTMTAWTVIEGGKDKLLPPDREPAELKLKAKAGRHAEAH